MVTSAIIAALSLQAPAEAVDDVPSGVPGVVVVDASGVEVGWVAVGNAKPALVGGRVEVTKRGGSSVASSGSILMHDDNVSTVSSARVQILFIQQF